jgi:DNA repair protein RecN (Recombination protein N)
VASRHRLLSNMEKVKGDAGAIYMALYETEGSILERLQGLDAVLDRLIDFDDQLKPVGETVRGAMAQLQDAAFELGRYMNRVDLEPTELDEVTERLNGLNRLIHKYGSAEIRGVLGQGRLDDVLAYRAYIAEEIDRLRSQSEDLSTIDDQIAPLATELGALGAKLSQKRRSAAKKLKPLIESQLAELGMAEATFDVDFSETGSDSEQAPSGLDTIEMLVRANPGQPARPLRKVASGGETSRIMLAIKSIAANANRLSVLVFDEVDANIGGRMGSVIGQKLRALAAEHQVLCITHLPQIAAHADHHLCIRKSIENGQTRTSVDALTTRDQRVDELAEMLTGKGPSATSRKHAREMLESVAEVVTTAPDKPNPTSKLDSGDTTGRAPRKSKRARAAA